SVPRTAAEAFHEVLEHKPNSGGPVSQRLTGENSFYRPGAMVGKNTDQVGRSGSGALDGRDEATFEKLNQAINSCHDFVRSLSEYAAARRKTVVRVHVVPDEMFGKLEYFHDGPIPTKHRQEKKCPFLLDHAWSVSGPYGNPILY